MTQAIFSRRDGMLVPSAHATGPWHPQLQHGGAPSALVVRAVEALESPAPMQLARLTVEFLKPVPLAPLEVTAEVVRPGRRLQLAEASVRSDGVEVCRARAVRLRREALGEASAAPARMAPPEDGYDGGWPIASQAEGFGRTAMELSFVAGRFDRPGPADCWFRARMPLVEGEDITPLQLTAAAADFGNGISAELDFDAFTFVNTDLTVHLARQPRGEWIGVSARTQPGPEGAALAWSELHDRDGPIGIAAQSLFVGPR